MDDFVVITSSNTNKVESFTNQLNGTYTVHWEGDWETDMQPNSIPFNWESTVPKIGELSNRIKELEAYIKQLEARQGEIRRVAEIENPKKADRLLRLD